MNFLLLQKDRNFAYSFKLFTVSWDDNISWKCHKRGLQHETNLYKQYHREQEPYCQKEQQLLFPFQLQNELKCNAVNLTYLVHRVHVWFYFDISCLEMFKPLVIIIQMHQCLSAPLLIEILGVLNENSPCLKAAHHFRVVWGITFGFPFSYCDHCKLCVNSSLVVIGMLNHHTEVTQMGDQPGWLAI